MSYEYINNLYAIYKKNYFILLIINVTSSVNIFYKLLLVFIQYIILYYY